MLGDVIRGNQCVAQAEMKGCQVGKLSGLWEPEVLEFHEFSTALPSMVGKYAVKLSITDLIKEMTET